MSTRILVFVLGLIFLAACSRAPNRPAVIGEGYVGPMSLNIRAELAVKAATVATVKHGDRVEILQRRRRFARVRTADGAEGWIDGRQLMTSQQMEALRQRAQNYADAPSMGAATVHDVLNVHTEPNRQAPSFHQIRENSPVEVLAHKVAPRVPYEPVAATPPAKPPPTPPRKKAEKSSSKLEKPQMPPAPEPPEDWLELSKADLDSEAPGTGEQQTIQTVKAPEPPPVRLDDWSLVRTKDGKVGWVLTRALIMAIPDEVAQYAEGHRITSYASLGTVLDDGAVKHHWLWTTMRGREEPYQFDSFRVFVYNARRNRYETAYIERNLKGYYPIEAYPQGLSGSGSPAFSLVVEDKDGGVYKRSYEFQGYRVRLISKEPFTLPPDPDAKPELVNVASVPSPERSVFGRIKDKIFGR